MESVEASEQGARWASASEFLESIDAPLVGHTITLGGLDTTMSFIRQPLTGEQNAIPVFFSGAVVNRAEATPPFSAGGASPRICAAR